LENKGFVVKNVVNKGGLMTKPNSMRNIPLREETKCHTFRINANTHPENNQLLGMECKMARHGSCAYCQAQAHNIYLNFIIDHGLPLDELIPKLAVINGCEGAGKGDNSCSQAVSKMLEKLCEALMKNEKQERVPD
jgi:hypothetical protein